MDAFTMKPSLYSFRLHGIVLWRGNFGSKLKCGNFSVRNMNNIHKIREVIFFQPNFAILPILRCFRVVVIDFVLFA